MGYRVDYLPLKKVRTMHLHNSRRAALTGLCFVCFLFAVFFCWPEGWALLRQLVVPGDPDTTVMALETFVQELVCGETMKEAFTRFCRSILTEAGVVSG